MGDLVRRPDPAFWTGKRVLLTGHTGFKGAWAARMLVSLGAVVTGYARDPVPGPSAFEILKVSSCLTDLRGELSGVGPAIAGAEVVLHLAAQAIVSEGYRDPTETWASNLFGTLAVLQALRGRTVQAAVIVTSDKVYRNDGTRAFVEGDPLGGDDPYSASKAACEVLVASHRASFADLPPMATARAGNVIGGGDFGLNRLIPDLVRARLSGRPLVLRNPEATRPFQHVLDVITAYLILAEDLARGTAPSAVNFGPAEAELSVRSLLALWQSVTGAPVDWQPAPEPPMPEKGRLALDSTLARTRLGWTPRLATAEATAATARWYQDWVSGQAMDRASDCAIDAFLKG
ncbi:MAG: CDP-glucose 4,6-dehydratase [Gemmobacter sp.]|jgi:CDP-glucose 4,6-dehydratase|nr:CDP-glucose 4,6-dehydratase [Gemmobacter sp.]